MAHYFTFSIIGAHIKNAENEIDKYKKSNLIIEQRNRRYLIGVFFNNKFDLNIDSRAKGLFHDCIEKLKVKHNNR